MEPDGSFMARVNPGKSVGPMAKKLGNHELGTILEPVFTAARDDFIAKLVADPGAKARIEAMRKARAANQPGALAGASNHAEQGQALIGSAPTIPPPPAGTKPKQRHRTNIEPSVDLSVATNDPASLVTSKIENISTYAGAKALIVSLSAKAAKYDIKDSTLMWLMNAKPPEYDTLDQILDDHMAPKLRTAADRKSAEVFKRELRRVRALTSVLENERAPGVEVASRLGDALVETGQVKADGEVANLQDRFGGGGEYGTMTELGASAMTPEGIAARRRAVGAIIDRLLSAAKNNEIIVSSGYNISQIGSAAQLWLDEKLRPYEDEKELAAAEALLRAEIVTFLSKFHGVA
jgi:hypothetical protein